MKKISLVSFFVFLTAVCTAFAARYNTLDGIDNLIPSIPSQWKNLLNPQTDEFWNEGNHRPDAGFLLFAKNPNLENAKLWLLRNEIKAKRMEQMLPIVEEAQRELVRQGLIEDRYDMVRSKPRRMISSSTNIPTSFEQIQKLPDKNLDVKINSLEFFFLFSSKCPFCMQMAQTIRSLPNVSPLQVDTNSPLYNFSGLPLSQYATPQTIQNYSKDGKVPVLVIYGRKNGMVQILKGVQSTETILLASANLLQTKTIKKGGGK